MFKTKTLPSLIVFTIAAMLSGAIAPALCEDGIESGAHGDPVKLEAANSSFFKGDYNAAKKYCLETAVPKAGKNRVTTPDDIADGADPSCHRNVRLLINIGQCHLGLKEPDKALSWFEHARKRLDKAPSPRPLDIADCWIGLGESHYMLGQTKQALREFSEAISFYQQKLGKWHPDNIPALEGLAGTKYIDGDFEGALPLYEQVARIDLAHYGATHPRLGFSLNDLAEVHYKMNGCPSSRMLYEQAFWIFKKYNSDKLLSKLDTSDTNYATKQQRIKDIVLGTMAPPDLEKTSLELLKTESFDPSRIKFTLRGQDFDNWRVPRRTAEDTLFVAIDPNVDQKGLIFCLHGLGLHSTSFSDFANKIVPLGYSVIALDVRGFGSFSMEKGLDKLDLNASLEDLAAALSLIRSHNPNLPIAVLGESMGGALALQLAAKYPENVNALISAVPSGKRYKSTQTSLLVGLKLLEDKKKPIEIGKRVIAQSTDDEMVRSVWLNDPGSRLKLSPEELLRFQEFMNQTEKFAKDIKKMPVIIFQGFKDHLVKPEGTIALYGELTTPQKDLVLVGDAEHLIFEEGQAPKDIVRMLAAWLDAHLQPKAAAVKAPAEQTD